MGTPNLAQLHVLLASQPPDAPTHAEERTKWEDDLTDELVSQTGKLKVWETCQTAFTTELGIPADDALMRIAEHLRDEACVMLEVLESDWWADLFCHKRPYSNANVQPLHAIVRAELLFNHHFGIAGHTSPRTEDDTDDTMLVLRHTKTCNVAMNKLLTTAAQARALDLVQQPDGLGVRLSRLLEDPTQPLIQSCYYCPERQPVHNREPLKCTMHEDGRRRFLTVGYYTPYTAREQQVIRVRGSRQAGASRFVYHAISVPQTEHERQLQAHYVSQIAEQQAQLSSLQRTVDGEVSPSSNVEDY